MYGFLLILEKVMGNSFRKKKNHLIFCLKWILTFITINILWLLFRAESVSQWWDMLISVFTMKNFKLSEGLIKAMIVPETAIFFDVLHLNALKIYFEGAWIAIVLLVSFGICLVPQNNYQKMTNKNFATMVFAALALSWGLLCISSESVFVYFNF